MQLPLNALLAKCARSTSPPRPQNKQHSDEAMYRPWLNSSSESGALERPHILAEPVRSHPWTGMSPGRSVVHRCVATTVPEPDAGREKNGVECCNSETDLRKPSPTK